MGIRKRISDGARSLGGKLGIVKEDGAGGEGTNRSPSTDSTAYPDSEARDASATPAETLNNRPEEIVISLKNLKNNLNTMSEIKNLAVKVGTQSCTLQTVIDTLKTDRDLAKQILITWIDQNYQSKMQNKSGNMALVYCLVNFAFRKDFRNEVAVKFGSKNDKLKNTVIAFARKNSLGINQLTNMFNELKSKSNDIVKPIQDLESGRAGKARRAKRKLLNKAKLAKETAKHKIRNKLKPTTIAINIPTQTATKDKQDETPKTCNLELITLSPKAQKEFEHLKTKVYGYGFSTVERQNQTRINTSDNTSTFLSELKTLNHPDFSHLKIKIENFKSLDQLTTLLSGNAPSIDLPYENAFIKQLLDTCNELKQQESACDKEPPQQIKTTKQPQQVITFPKTVTYKQTKQFTDQQEMAEPEQIQSRSEPEPKQNQSPSNTTIFPESLNPKNTPATETYDPAESFIIDKCTSILSDTNAKYENAAKALKEIQSNQLTQNLRPVLCKLPDPLAPTTFPKDIDLPGLSQKSYSYLKQLWEKTKTLAQQEGITNPPSSGKRITANFPISAPNANNLQHISFSAPNFHPDPKTDKQTQQQPELTDQQTIDDDNDEIIKICQEKDLLHEQTQPLTAILSKLDQLQTSLQITSLKDYFTKLITGLNNTDTLDYQHLPKQPKELGILAYNQVNQLWKKAQDLLIWQNISSYIHTNVQQITNTANTLKNLKDQFQSFLAKNKATQMQNALRTILDCLNRPDFAKLTFWTKKTLEDYKIHITDETYKTLSEFWDKAKTLASSPTKSQPNKTYEPTNLNTHSSTTQITTNSTNEQQNPPEPQDQKTKDDPPPNDNENAEDPPPPPEDDDHVPPPKTDDQDEDKIPPPPDDDPPMQEDYNLLNSAWSEIDTTPNLTLSEILDHLKTCQTQAQNNDVKTYLQTLITQMNKTDFLQQDPPTEASRGSISRDGGQNILTTLDKIWEKAKSVANNQHIDSD